MHCGPSCYRKNDNVPLNEKQGVPCGSYQTEISQPPSPPGAAPRRSRSVAAPRCSSPPAAPGPRDAPLHCLSCCSTPRTGHLASSACGRAGTRDGTGTSSGNFKRSRYQVAAMDQGGGGSIWIRAAVAVAAGAAIAARAVRRKSVDSSAVFVGVPAMVAHTIAGYRFAGLLLVFFFTSSRVTRVGEARKRVLDPEFKEGGQRNWKQVLSNSGIASILVVLIASVTGGTDRCLDSKESTLVTALIGGVIGHYACCNGDTWSSELGILSKAEPRIITTFKRVWKGTNGGVTIDGLLAAAAAGFSIGLAFVLIGLFTTQCASDVFWSQLLVIPLATAAGLCGSLIDSFLGATVQYSGFCSVRNKVVGVDGPTVTRISGMNILDNNGVNVVSVFLTTVLTAVACTYIF